MSVKAFFSDLPGKMRGFFRELPGKTVKFFRELPGKTIASAVDLGHSFGELPQNLKRSATELYNIRSLCGISMLLAVAVALNYTTSFYIMPTLKIGPGYLITALLGMLYGPVAGGIAAGLGDIIKYLLKPDGVFFFGYTLNAILGGVIYGIFLYKAKVGFLRCILAKLIINLGVNAGLGTLWSAMLYGKAFTVILPARLITNVVKVPFEVIILMILLPMVIHALKRAKVKL
ncbi:MAG: folate family ECF transporter S component [Oscillospiraceae bacterium]|nr:folate family ECF transporter S component [Oscillospiraceae bacterium]